jgi:hypothetical protein
MPHNAALAGTILLALCSACVISEDATARPRGYIDGRRIVCGGGSIPVRVYAAIATTRGRAFAAADQ